MKKNCYQFGYFASKFGGENKKGTKGLSNTYASENPIALWPYCPNAFKRKAFTLAEVLITLAIIGVVSALVIPSVLKNYNDKKYNTARLKALKTFGEAGKLASINDEMNSQANATDFVNNVLSKYLKITKVCTLANSKDCGFPSEIQPSNPAPNQKKRTVNLATWGQIGYNIANVTQAPVNVTTMSIVIATNDGFSALIHYNPKCARDSREITWNCASRFKECHHVATEAACMNVVYDMNGTKAPNHVGEDIGIVTVFWSGNKATSAAPGIIPYNTAKAIYDEGNLNWTDAQQRCVKRGTKSVPYTLPSLDELQSMMVNSYLASFNNGYYFWSGAPAATRLGIGWYLVYIGGYYNFKATDELGVWCVRR